MTTTLLRAALDALVYHTDQTRPIHSTQMTIDAIRAHLAAQPLHEQLREMGEAHAAQPAPVPVPPGYKLVPVEPTPEMVDAARISGAEGTDEQIASDLRAAIAASPEVPRG
jgi:hypothetical protein